VGAQGYRSVYKEPKFAVISTPENNSLMVRPIGGDTSSIKPGFQIRFVYNTSTTEKEGRNLIGKMHYTVTAVNPQADGSIRISFDGDYSQEGARGKIKPNSIEIKNNTVQQVNRADGQSVTVDWNQKASDIAKILNVDTKKAEAMKVSNTVQNFGFDSLDEAVQHWAASGLPLAPEDSDKLHVARNVTSEDLEQWYAQNRGAETTPEQESETAVPSKMQGRAPAKPDFVAPPAPPAQPAQPAQPAKPAQSTQKPSATDEAEHEEEDQGLNVFGSAKGMVKTAMVKTAMRNLFSMYVRLKNQGRFAEAEQVLNLLKEK
jgi:hypothetical protein